MQQLSGGSKKSPVQVRVGPLEIRLAGTPQEIDAAQALRYQVFYEEMAAKPSDQVRKLRRDFDRFDQFCDHLIILNHQDSGEQPNSHPLDQPHVVATYRLMKREAAKRCGQFYSQDEYDISRLMAHPGEIMELGRSCVAKQYRTGPAMQLLWRGIVEYVRFYQVQIMFGCASLPGTNLQELSTQLAYLHHFHLAPPDLRAVAVTKRYVNMNMVPKEKINVRATLTSLPPLIKGYLRLGGFIGEGAVVDEQFNTTDVNVVVKTDLVTGKYIRHYTVREEEN